MAVTIKIQFNGKYLTIPINPEELSISRSADNDDIDIIGIGKATRKGEPGLISLTISSFFPGSNSYFYTEVKPKTCINFINTIWKTENKNNNVAKITTTGLPKNLNMYFVIESFDYTYKAGEESDAYYNLKIKEYKSYGVRTVSKKKKSSKSRTKSTAVKRSSSSNTYTVQKGDCLWNIAKAASGSGSNWKKLYNLNKKVIGSNPNLIKPGQKLVLPDGWKTSIKVTKLKATKTTSSKVTSKKSTTTKKSSNKSSTSSTTSIQAPAANTKKSTTYKRTIASSATSKLAASGKITLATSKTKSSGGGSSW